MTKHAMERINQRYGRELTQQEKDILHTILKKQLYLEVVKDFCPADKITVLVRFNKIPLKLIYAPKQNKIITALPLDVDEFNTYSDLVPDVDIKAVQNLEIKAQVENIKIKFEDKFKNKNIFREYVLEERLKSKTTFFVKNPAPRFVIVWFKKTDNIYYIVYSKAALKKKLWHLIIKSFRENDSNLLIQTNKLYSKIYK